MIKIPYVLEPEGPYCLRILIFVRKFFTLTMNVFLSVWCMRADSGHTDFSRHMNRFRRLPKRIFSNERGKRPRRSFDSPRLRAIKGQQTLRGTYAVLPL